MKTIHLVRIFQDGMILQRDKPIRVWGETAVDQTIEVSIGASSSSAFFKKGNFSLVLEAQKLTYETEMKVQGKDETQIIRSIAIGDVYIAAGQSNMEFSMWQDKEYQKELATCENERIRFYDVSEIRFPGHENYADFSKFECWRKCDKENLGYFSAVGYYFAKKISQKMPEIPIGIVGCNYGGTSASCWIDPQRLNGKLKVYMDEYEKSVSRIENMEEHKNSEIKLAKLITVSGEPTKGIAKVFEKLIADGHALWYEKLLGKLIYQWAKNSQMCIGPYSAGRPGGLYECMMTRIAGVTARAVLWYQGESDDVHAELYDCLLTEMISFWRDYFQDELPFYIVQLAPLKQWLMSTGKNYPEIRKRQEMVCNTVSKCYLASIMDAGEKTCIHPGHKRAPGERLALLALRHEYNVPLLCDSPKMSEGYIQNGKLILVFDHAGSGLRLTEGKQIKGLDVIADGKSVKYNFRMEKDRLELQSPFFDTAKCVTVNYAYVDYVKVNLINSAGLPARPARLNIERR